MKTIAFFGHKKIYKKDKLRERLIKILNECVPQGYSKFLIGTHGDFDSMVLMSSLNYKKNINCNLRITIVLTSFNILKRDSLGYCKFDYYKNQGCESVIYNIEEEYFKNRIIKSNKKMVDECDLVVCYVDMKKMDSGARKAVKYAIKQGKKVINLFREDDKPFYGMTKEEIEIEWQKIKKEISNIKFKHK